MACPLTQRIEHLRLVKMIKALGLNFSHYLHQVPLIEIQQSMTTCETCTATGTCDDMLQQETISASDTNFCPIHESLAQFTIMNAKAAEIEH